MRVVPARNSTASVIQKKQKKKNDLIESKIELPNEKKSGTFWVVVSLYASRLLPPELTNTFSSLNVK